MSPHVAALFRSLRSRRGIALGVSALSLASFVELTSEVADGEVAALDRELLVFLATFRGPIINEATVELTALGSATVLVVIVVVATMFLALRRDHRAILQLVLASAGSAALSTVFKRLFDRERPDVVSALVRVTSSSYPSGHALAAAGIYITLALLAVRQFRTAREFALMLSIALVVVVTVGVSRVFIGVHYPSDVAAGLLLGSGWALILDAIFHRSETAGDSKS